MKIGVGVEGPSDRIFWDKLLHKSFSPAVRFDVRAMKDRARLIRSTPALLESFRGLHYAAGFILVDRDKDPCIEAILHLFDAAVRPEARLPVEQRYLSICVAIRGFEAWLLADESAIKELLPNARYNAPNETASLNPKETLRTLWRQQYGSNAAINKIDFAKRAAPRFDPASAQMRSASFRYFWSRMTTVCSRPGGSG